MLKTKRRKPKKRHTNPDRLVAYSPQLCKPADDACFPIFRGMRCLMCGGTHNVVGHHVIRRARSRHYRHHICNIVPLCQECHCAVERESTAQVRLMEAIRRDDVCWYRWILWAIGENHQRAVRGDKPDFRAALAWWTAHEDSGLTVEWARRNYLDEHPQEQSQ